jgi:hypothetical protein
MLDSEVDKWRFVAMICLQLMAKRPLPDVPEYWRKQGFDLKARPMAATLKALAQFVTIMEGDGTQLEAPCLGDGAAAAAAAQDKILGLEADAIYKLYPSKRSNGSSTGKSGKDRTHILTILKKGEYPIREAVQLYVAKTNPRYYQSLSRFLNSRPDLDALRQAADYRPGAEGGDRPNALSGIQGRDFKKGISNDGRIK